MRGRATITIEYADRADIPEALDRFAFEYIRSDQRVMQFGGSTLSYSVVDEMPETEIPRAAEASCDEGET